MKFYEKIIGINKENPAQEMKIEFNNNGFLFDKGITTNAGLTGKTLKIKDISTNILECSSSASKEWKWSVGDRYLLWGFWASSNFIEPGGNWSLGLSDAPWAEIYSMKGYFSELLPYESTQTIGNEETPWYGLHTQNARITTANITNLNLTNSVNLPYNSRVLDSNNDPLSLGGIKINVEEGSVAFGFVLRDQDQRSGDAFIRMTKGSFSTRINTWTTVVFRQTFTYPPTVVAQNIDPTLPMATIVLKDITKTSFKCQSFSGGSAVAIYGNYIAMGG